MLISFKFFTHLFADLILSFYQTFEICALFVSLHTCIMSKLLLLFVCYIPYFIWLIQKKLLSHFVKIWQKQSLQISNVWKIKWQREWKQLLNIFAIISVRIRKIMSVKFVHNQAFLSYYLYLLLIIYLLPSFKETVFSVLISVCKNYSFRRFLVMKASLLH